MRYKKHEYPNYRAEYKLNIALSRIEKRQNRVVSKGRFDCKK
jgi:hypothetical protein